MADKIRKGKKSWVRIVGPTSFKNNFLGESYVYDGKELIGRKIRINLSRLNGDMRVQNIFIVFKIKESKGPEVYADIVSYEVSQSHIKRIVRTNRDKIDDSFIVESKDKVKLRVKPVIMTVNKAKNSILTALRSNTRENLKGFFSQSDLKSALDDIMLGKLQKAVKQNLKKIYPVSALEIRKLEVLNR